ncbi:aryl-alcohol dehydrogenase [Scytonema sp. UIC 10036]|uniref:aldo/keto reductase n=1 Tax=Scytonema sp. UIC 10036 TaxID=2304196 RepID=UPI0012DA02A0|nr:aldo/keto reductase [Scytonema sp. UIC 10036]MUG97027.1 aryl-alcohol dehydrogenase [Scytonema sp. UIC 10036]
MKIGLGTAQFGLNYGISNLLGKTSAEEVEKILEVAIRNGVSFIDTAPGYGTSEEILGKKILHDSIFQIITKTPKFSDNSITKDDVEMLEKTFLQSISKLNKASVYGLLVHNADDLLSENGDLLIKKMQELKSQNLVKKIGVSIYNGEQIEKILDSYPIDLIQVPINVLDQRLLFSGYLHKLKKFNIEIHARSIFLQGLLLMNPEHVSSFFNSIREHLKIYHEFILSKGITPIQAALNFVTQLTDIDVVLVGINNHQQLKEIFLASTDSCPISSQEFAQFALTDKFILNPGYWRL